MGFIRMPLTKIISSFDQAHRFMFPSRHPFFHSLSRVTFYPCLSFALYTVGVLYRASLQNIYIRTIGIIDITVIGIMELLQLLYFMGAVVTCSGSVSSKCPKFDSTPTGRMFLSRTLPRFLSSADLERKINCVWVVSRTLQISLQRSQKNDMHMDWRLPLYDWP